MKTLIVWALAGAALVAVGTAGATPPKCDKKIQLFSSDTAIIAWQSPRLDSPRDPNSARIGIHVLNQDGDDYALAYSKCSGAEHKKVGDVRNLSFEFLNQTGNPDVHVGNGAPRYSVDIDADGDGSYDYSAFLSGYFCNEPMAENPKWSRADFTGRISAGCELQANGVSYISDGAKSAWKLFAEANPNAKLYGDLAPAYLVMDEAGTAYVDRLAFHNIMYQASGTGSSAAKTCSNESAC
jgi:hypothetical protein